MVEGWRLWGIVSSVIRRGRDRELIGHEHVLRVGKNSGSGKAWNVGWEILALQERCVYMRGVRLSSADLGFSEDRCGEDGLMNNKKIWVGWP
jgi:hypothetical protein